MKQSPGIKHLSFEYHKDNGDISDRNVIQFELQHNGNLLCVDVSGIDDEFILKSIADELGAAKREYLDRVYSAVRSAGFQIKTFTPSKMKNVKDTTATVFRDAK